MKIDFFSWLEPGFNKKIFLNVDYLLYPQTVFSRFAEFFKNNCPLNIEVNDKIIENSTRKNQSRKGIYEQY